MQVVITGRIADSGGLPENGRIEFAQAQRFNTGEMLVTGSIAVAQVVLGELRAERGGQFELPANPEGTAVRIREILGGQTFEWWASVPAVGSIEYRDLAPVETSSVPESVWGPPPWLAEAEQMRDETVSAIAEGLEVIETLGGLTELQGLTDRAETAADAAEVSAAASTDAVVSAGSAADRAEAAASSAAVDAVENVAAAVKAEADRAESEADRAEAAADNVDPVAIHAKIETVKWAGVDISPAAGDMPVNLYVPRLYTHLRSPVASLAGARAVIREGLSGALKRVAFVGHSIVAGLGGTPGVIDLPRLFTRAAQMYGEAGTGIVTTANGITSDARLAYSGLDWVNDGGPRVDNLQLHRKAVPGITSAITLEAGMADPGTVVDVYSFTNSGKIEYSIDNASFREVPLAGPANSIVRGRQTLDIPLGQHRVRVRPVSGDPPAKFVLGLGVHTNRGLLIGNFGFSGSVVADWLPSHNGGAFYNPYKCVDFYDPHLVVIQLGANELIHGRSASELQTNIRALVTAFRAAGREVVVVIDPPLESSAISQWGTYRSALLAGVNLASPLVPVIDLTAYWGSRAEAAAQGLYSDQWHPSSKGYIDLASPLINALIR